MDAQEIAPSATSTPIRSFPIAAFMSAVSRYGCAVSSVFAGVVLRMFVAPYVGDTFRFVFIFPAVAVTALYGGMGPALLATLLGSLAGVYLFQSPTHPLNVPSNWIGFIVTWFVCLSITLSAEVQHRTQARLAEAVNIARQQRERLEEEARQRIETEARLNQKRDQIEALNERLRQSMRETHHRVKNNLQLISSLVDMQIEEDNVSVPITEMKRLRTHITTLSRIHDLLTQHARDGGEADTLSSRAALLKLVDLVQGTIADRRLKYKFVDVQLGTRQITSLTVVANELLSNAFKHSAQNVTMTLTEADQCLVLEVCDEGPGFPPDFNPQEAAHTGLELIESLSRWDLRGETVYRNRPEGGASVTVTFPILPIPA